jgi:hypothetical protein
MRARDQLPSELKYGTVRGVAIATLENVIIVDFETAPALLEPSGGIAPEDEILRSTPE